MTRRDWWIGIIVLACGLLVNAFMPRHRFEIQDGRTGGVVVYRIDQWRGTVEVFATGAEFPKWLTFAPSRAANRDQ